MAYLIMIFSVLSRLIPHAWNFSPVYGALLFGGARMKKRDSVWFPLVFLAASDFVLTNLLYHLRVGWQEMIQLASFAAIAMIGWTLRSRVTIPRFTVACLAAPLSFYLISNFGVWIGFHTYPPTWSGLMACYAAGIPYQGRVTASTVLFAGFFFGAEHLYRVRIERKRNAHAITG
ncbi:MAG: hypothetical protein AUG89_11990 [Acidobacteria bacterium 13_1_20CM_4_56_7]|jgi:hypothetical protein|nr:MAG: hypothetical protein AUG89_11990 [Acidobacteria bacterium 13_1_20CM_4_56_7]PYV49829.1 MAG: hypothetical protein DMG92_09815 [Acidobacteriota bacterium]